MKRLLITLAAVGVGAAVPLLLAARQASDDDPAAFLIELAEFQRLHTEQAVLVVDVRNPQAYLDGHVEGAVSIPLDTIDMKIEQLRLVEQPIVTYCRCYEEATSLLAAQRLGRYGIEGARALVGGFDAWAEAGGKVATGEAADADAALPPVPVEPEAESEGSEKSEGPTPTPDPSVDPAR